MGKLQFSGVAISGLPSVLTMLLQYIYTYFSLPYTYSKLNELALSSSKYPNNMHSYFPKTLRKNGCHLKKKYASEHTTSDLFAFKHLIGGFDWKKVL